MGQLKEADFLRWGSTKRMTSLRKAEQDGMWEGVKEREHTHEDLFHDDALTCTPLHRQLR